MTPRKCPVVLDCPNVWRILEQCCSDHKSVLNTKVVEKVIAICASCTEPPEIGKFADWFGDDMDIRQVIETM